MRRLWHDRGGATLIEFAILLPVLMALLMGLMDISYQAYVQAVLEGAVQKAGRDSTIEAADTATIDARVVTSVRRVAGNATVTPSRRSYASFGLIKAESYTDNNGNNRYDAGDCFTDVNGNGQWDADPGIVGQGSASDVTVYKVTVTYGRLFLMAGLIGWSNQVVLSASTRFKNQPYNAQSVPTQQVLCK
ncbi:TadE/TadG family type IV pilus assembly protein [Sphingomonas elodea]|uniref:TadE/TadG family type IV pilus assembly protein n=1 Tax=Sphingomonas elodea TaxID=179878 RepID=UPI0002630ACF|nr:TadE/TadG family type IV pilus assembly protein [Sphingomonas elodea]